jgi:hypothetical protein
LTSGAMVRDRRSAETRGPPLVCVRFLLFIDCLPIAPDVAPEARAEIVARYWIGPAQNVRDKSQ